MQITHDFSDFNPEGFTFPPSGFYSMAVTSQDEGKTKAGDAKLTLTFQIADGDQKGQQFKMDYNTGHSSTKTSKIAIENIARLYYGATGNKPGRSGLNTADMMNKPFGANLVIEEKAFSRDDGTEGKFTNAKLNGIQFLNNDPVAVTNAAPAQTNTAAPWK